jgi:uncharacterized membrane protein YphA (DoxX/SURF4 family)
MHMTHNILLGILAVIFLISGLSKVSGNPKGLSGTREVNVPDWFARVTGVIEVLAALGLIHGIRYSGSFLGWISVVVLWFTMGGAIIAHNRAKKMKTAFPAAVLMLLLTIVLVIA